MSLVSALSKLLVKMGGTPATGDTSDELVDKIADTYAPGGGVLVVHAEEAQNVVLTGTLPDVSGYEWKSEMAGTFQYYVSITCDLDGYDLSTCTVTIGDDEYSSDDLGYSSGTLKIHVGSSGTGHENESDVLGKTITVTATQTRLDKTWQEIYDAGFSVLELHRSQFNGNQYGFLAQIVESDGDYAVVFLKLGNPITPLIYVANSANGYPVYTEDA